jgi:hypothetical protein
MSSVTQQIERAQGGKKLSFTVFSPKSVKESEFNFRALPYKFGEDNNPFIEVHVHNNIGLEKKEYATCPSKMIGEDCPYCKNAKELKDTLPADDWKKIAKRFYPSSNVYIPGIARFAKYSEFGFLKISAYQNFQQQVIGILTSKQLKKLFKLDESTPFIPVWNLQNGLDFIVKKLEKSKENLYERFVVESELELTPAGRKPEEIQLIKDYWANTPNVIDEMIQLWGCKEKINGIFIKQYPKYAVKLGLISQADVKTTAETPILPESNSEQTDTDLPDGLEDMMDSQLNSSDNTSSVKSDANPELDDEYAKLMKELGN